MPRLSQELTGPRHPERCQKCGRHKSELTELGATLTIWQEHDEHDRPEAIYVPLCSLCNLSGETKSGNKQRGIIARHPRLYNWIEENAPIPGIMHLCVRCEWRDDLRCAHPDLTINGGKGLSILCQKTDPAHFNCGSARNNFWLMGYKPAISCAGREEETCLDALMGPVDEEPAEGTALDEYVPNPG